MENLPVIIVPAEAQKPTEAQPIEYKPDPAEVEALAKMLYGEARGVRSKAEQAACVWCVLNRVDSGIFPDDVIAVVSMPDQFAGYSPNHPVLPQLEALAADVLSRHNAERNGERDSGRTLPPEYLYFTGDGDRNHFTIEWLGTETWGWTLPSPYDEGGCEYGN